MRTALIALVPLIVVCEIQTRILNGGDPAAPIVTTPSCDGMARVLSPVSDGQSDFYFRDDIAFEITEGEDAVEISLMGIEGTVLSGMTWIDPMVHTEGWTRIVFTPDEPLAPNTMHTATLAFCGRAPSVAFTTSALGTPMETPEEISGRTYEINLADARIIQPSQVAQALLALIDHSLMVQLDAAADGGLDMTIGAADKASGIQDTCIPALSVDVSGDFSGPPTFAVGPVDVAFDLAGYAVTLFSATAEATFAADGAYFAGGRLAGTLDARDIVDALSGRDVLPVEDAAAICETITQVGLACTPCADGQMLCLDVAVEDVQGDLTDRAIEGVADFDCHADCESACDNEDCTTADQFEICL